MILVGLLTIEQKEILIGQLWADDSYFNPVQDNDDRWIISTQEINGCDRDEFLWIKDLPLIEWVPKYVDS